MGREKREKGREKREYKERLKEEALQAEQSEKTIKKETSRRRRKTKTILTGGLVLSIIGSGIHILKKDEEDLDTDKIENLEDPYQAPYETNPIILEEYQGDLNKPLSQEEIEIGNKLVELIQEETNLLYKFQRANNGYPDDNLAANDAGRFNKNIQNKLITEFPNKNINQSPDPKQFEDWCRKLLIRMRILFNIKLETVNNKKYNDIDCLEVDSIKQTSSSLNGLPVLLLGKELTSSDFYNRNINSAEINNFGAYSHKNKWIEIFSSKKRFIPELSKNENDQYILANEIAHANISRTHPLVPKKLEEAYSDMCSLKHLGGKNIHHTLTAIFNNRSKIYELSRILIKKSVLKTFSVPEWFLELDPKYKNIEPIEQSIIYLDYLRQNNYRSYCSIGDQIIDKIEKTVNEEIAKH